MLVSRRGSSLVEILISIIIIGVVIISVMMSLLVNIRNTMALKDDENARQLAMGVMEDCEAVRFNLDNSAYEQDIVGKGKQIRGYDATARVRSFGGAPAAGHPPISADIEVVVKWHTALEMNKEYFLRRELSVSGWQNAGERSF
jgi:type II secretory pathway pseudopilin PulG